MKYGLKHCTMKLYGEPRPPKVMALSLKYKETQEHLVRRLGQALVLHWDELPDDLQDVLIDQAVVVEDRDEAPHESGRHRAVYPFRENDEDKSQLELKNVARFQRCV